MTLDEVYDDLVSIVSEVGAQVDVPREAEAFFTAVVERCATKEDCLEHVRDNLRTWFRAVHSYPVWIQEAEWQFAQGRPMIFVGQVDVPAAKGLLHDDSSFFVFWDPEGGEIRTVSQVA